MFQEQYKKALLYLLDALSGSTFIFAWISGQDLFMMLGGLASLLAAANHIDQIIERRKKQKQNQ